MQPNVRHVFHYFNKTANEIRFLVMSRVVFNWWIKKMKEKPLALNVWRQWQWQKQRQRQRHETLVVCFHLEGTFLLGMAFGIICSSFWLSLLAAGCWWITNTWKHCRYLPRRFLFLLLVFILIHILLINVFPIFTYTCSRYVIVCLNYLMCSVLNKELRMFSPTQI